MVALTKSVTSGMLRSSAIWQSGSTLITPLDKASRRLFETRFSRKSGTRLSDSIKEFRASASRRRNHLRRPDQALKLQAELLQTLDRHRRGQRARARYGVLLGI